MRERGRDQIPSVLGSPEGTLAKIGFTACIKMFVRMYDYWKKNSQYKKSEHGLAREQVYELVEQRSCRQKKLQGPLEHTQHSKNTGDNTFGIVT